MVRRSRLDAELVRRGLARSREHAVALIAEGRVAVSGRAASKPATGVDASTSRSADTSQDSAAPINLQWGMDNRTVGWTPARPPVASPRCC